MGLSNDSQDLINELIQQMLIMVLPAGWNEKRAHESTYDVV